jgi:hypothetical protein
MNNKRWRLENGNYLDCDLVANYRELKWRLVRNSELISNPDLVSSPD